MSTERIALVTGANQGLGKQVATELARDGVRVLMGCRDLDRGRRAAAEVGGSATAVHLDVTDPASVGAAAQWIEQELGHLDLLVNNAGASSAGGERRSLAEARAGAHPSRVRIDDVRAVWEVNVFGVLAVYQAMLPLLRRSSDARIVNVTSALGSLTLAAHPDAGTRAAYEPVYAASKTALNALTLAMMVELEDTDICVNLVSPGFARTALVNFEGTETVEEAAREIVRVARLGPGGPTGTFTTWEGVAVPW
ncbi:SDR family NAD(P)-dependent oxidoreductase [Nocardioides sp. CPCC 205120]|uniref:SDR family NAD(P)-dependent oxidoreductase n=1 Tax=Nocardioides sp. CPCC 205120 TaxID=3406462 RepID=UPI003B503FEB